MTASRSTGSPLQISSTASSVQPPEKTDIAPEDALFGGGSAARTTSRWPHEVSRAVRRRPAVRRPALEIGGRGAGRVRRDSTRSPAPRPARWPAAHRRGVGTPPPRRGRCVGQREVGLDVSCPLDEQTDGVRRAEAARSSSAAPGSPGRQRNQLLAVDRQALAAGCQHDDTCGHCRSIRVTSRATAPTRCSQLSSTNRAACWQAFREVNLQGTARFESSGGIADATASTTPSGSRTGASSTNQASVAIAGQHVGRDL